jgi:hypothetical protein
MTQDNLPFYTDDTFNNWTVLPQLELRGVGTPYVESLASYVLRLCDISNITVSNLAEVLNSYTKNPIKFCSSTMFNWSGFFPEIEHCLKLLTQFTGQTNLHKGTFYYVANTLNKRSIISKLSGTSPRQWCPKCYLNWNDDLSYEPLIWSFTVLSVCPIHKVYMESQCSSCKALQPTLRQYSSRRLCSKCKSSLGHEGEKAKGSIAEDWIINRLTSFSIYIQNLDRDIPLSRYYECMHELKMRRNQGEEIPPAVRAFLKNRSKAPRFKNECSIPTIDHFLNVCAFLGCGIEDILETPRLSAQLPLMDRFTNFTNLPFERRTVKYNVRRIGIAFEQLLEHDEIYLPPIPLLAKCFNAPLSTLNTYYPDLIGRYKDRLDKEFLFSVRHAQRRALKTALRILDSEYNEHFDINDFAVIAIRIAEEAKLILPLARTCLETAIAMHNLRYSLRDIDNGTIQQTKDLNTWIFNEFKPEI